MDVADLDRLLATTRRREVLLLQEDVPVLVGWRREVFLRRDWRIVVEVRQRGYDEGGVIFEAEPTGREEALRLLETILEAPVSEWRAHQPEAETVADFYSPGMEIVGWIRNGDVHVPPIPPFKILDAYWSELVEAGSGT